MSMHGFETPNQGSGSVTDAVTQLRAIARQLGAWVQAFNGRLVSGSFTLSAAASTTVAQPSVAVTSYIWLTPTNADAATLMGSAASLYVSAKTASTSFAVATADGSSASGTETFDYIIFTPS